MDQVPTWEIPQADDQIRALEQGVKTFLWKDDAAFSVQTLADVYAPQHYVEELLSDEYQESFIKGRFFAELNDYEKAVSVRALQIDESDSWHALTGEGQESDNMLFESDAPGARPFTSASPTDKLVLSGAIGSELLVESKRLSALMAEITPGRLDQAVLLGGVAMVAAQRNRSIDSLSYESSVGDGVGARTMLGADIHGDFRMRRQSRAQHGFIDPLGRVSIAGPVGEAENVAAYHSTEPQILATVLRYMVQRQGKTREQVFKEVSTIPLKFRDRDPLNPFDQNPFADFGQNDGDMGGRWLHSALDRHEEGPLLTSIYVHPGAKDNRLVMIAEEGGIRFSQQVNEKEFKGLFIPDGELAQFSSTLIASEFGRTSVSALLNVLHALIQPKNQL